MDKLLRGWSAHFVIKGGCVWLVSIEEGEGLEAYGQLIRRDVVEMIYGPGHPGGSLLCGLGYACISCDAP